MTPVIAAPTDTHEVFNQSTPLADLNLFDTHHALQDALRLQAPGLDAAQLQPLRQLGARAGSAAMQAHARLANTHLPQLHTHDRFGRRIDEVDRKSVV